MTQPVRNRIYTVLAALGALALVYGLATDQEIAAWLRVLEALLIGGNGLAAAWSLPATVTVTRK